MVIGKRVKIYGRKMVTKPMSIGKRKKFPKSNRKKENINGIMPQTRKWSRKSITTDKMEKKGIMVRKKKRIITKRIKRLMKESKSIK